MNRLDKGNPGNYDYCSCGTIKRKISKGCKDCRKKRPAVSQPENNLVRHIPLTKGDVAIVDAFKYDELTRRSWLVVRKNRHGKYPATTINGKIVYMARLLMDAKPGEYIDHKNRNTLDNRMDNLRRCTKSQNAVNADLNENNKSGYKGVFWNSAEKVWSARIRVGKKQFTVGRSSCKKTAALAYNAAAVKYFGEFAVLNQIP